jgi:isoleucyl-tRNA synthetase
MQPDSKEEKSQKSTHALREESILASWKEKGIFEKSLNKWPEGKAPKGEFIFYEGPPTANGHPHIGHFEGRAFKDAIPRYKTMQGYHVRRKGGWDTHGLPVELQVEKELGLKSKKEIEKYGIAAFNEKCKESVWTYMHEWEQFTDRMGFWVDLKNAYVPYKPAYIEALWNIMRTVHEKDLLYKDYKVVPWCPRCGTGLSSHEIAQGYKDVKDLAVTVKFEIRNSNDGGKTYLLAWTTTPWTLPGNVGLAVGEKVEYVKVKTEQGLFILAKERLEQVFKEAKYEIIETFKGKDLVGLSYEPLYPFLKDSITGPEKEKLDNAYKVYAADFVTTEDGTGIVHTAVMYGQDDFVLGTKVGLPKFHLVNEDGTFKKEAGFLAGKFVKDEATDVEIIKDLAHRGHLFSKEKYQHSYPFCWRCHTPLIYFARDSWYIKMSALRHKLVKENEGIHWEPEHIKEGRFGEWLREVKDWAISRERYWGTPLPVWVCDKCKKWKVAGSVADVSKKPRNTYYVMRHGEAENNVKHLLNGGERDRWHLTDKGKEEVGKTADELKHAGIDLIFTSPIARARDTAKIVQEKLGLKDSQVIIDERLREVGFGEFEGKDSLEFNEKFPWKERFDRMPSGAERYADVKKRVGDFLYEIDGRYQGKKILIVSHGTPSMMLMSVGHGLDRRQSIELEMSGEYIQKAEIKKLDFTVIPHNPEYELDLHRSYIDEIKLSCTCGGEMSRVKEVMDVWFDSGAMPFAQDHVLGGKEHGLFGKEKFPYPADFISEAIDQTRGWFYTLHAVGTLMGRGKAFKNVICLGHVLDAEGKKMSKSIGNVVNPAEMMDAYGADALRLWMYSVNQPGDSKNFDPKTVDEINKKVFNMVGNVLSFYKLYAGEQKLGASSREPGESKHILDRWIISRLNELIETVTNGLDGYQFFEPVRAIRDFVGDLSQWYLRRSRDRFKGENAEDKEAALATTRYVLLTLAKIMAPMAPFFADYLYQGVGGEKESVHLEEWPKEGKIDRELLKDMDMVRSIASKGLEARMAAKINVRQPLGRLKIKDSKIKELSVELVELIEAEVNVKELIFDANIEQDVELDTAITPELKEEGDLRELLRKIQDLRKEKGLTVSDGARLIVPSDVMVLARKYETQIKRSTNVKELIIGATLSIEMDR